MANLITRHSKTKSITYAVQFEIDGQRKTIGLQGIKSKTRAIGIKEKIESIVTARKYNRDLDGATLAWLDSIGQWLREKLKTAGLMADSISLGELLKNYLEARKDAKPNTRKNWLQTQRRLIEFFGKDKPIDSITAGDAKDFERWLHAAKRLDGCKKKLSPATIQKNLSKSKQVFSDAVEREILPKNPFASIKPKNLVDATRQAYIDVETIEKVIDACPDSQWRLIVALARFGGLRCPSEVLALTWDCVFWDKNRIRVKSPKTEHHAGHDERFIPIFPELKPLLEEAYLIAQPGIESPNDGPIITRYRDSSANLRTSLHRIIRRAGLKPWPKVFQNLRASCATDLEKRCGANRAAKFLGHSTIIAGKHYWQVTDQDFLEFSESPESAALQKRCVPTSNWGASSFEKVQKTAQNRKSGHGKVPQVAETGIEPAHLAVLDPKSSASANSATRPSDWGRALLAFPT